MKTKRFGFTMIELLTTIGIIALLIGLLIPSLNMVKKHAKNTQQRAQLTAIEIALTVFRNDYGDYPPSGYQWDNIANKIMYNYSGAQMLAEAMLGWDLLGFHPDTAWRADGYDKNGKEFAYDPLDVRTGQSLKERKGAYLDAEKANAFLLGNATDNSQEGLFVNVTKDTEPANTYVLCDVYAAKRIRIREKSVTAGTPILYFRANTSSKTLNPSLDFDQLIYNAFDNYNLVHLGSIKDRKKHWLFYDRLNDPQQNNEDASYFYAYDYLGGITDSKISTATRLWPRNPESFILISAGLDGLYGTQDDIRNFGD